MKDIHIHLENGPYTQAWLMKFVEVAQSREINEIWVLEHTHRFYEFNPMYQEMSEVSDKQATWLKTKNQIPLSSYINFIRAMRTRSFPVKIRFGLEVCFFPQHIDFIRQQLSVFKFDFVVGSVHSINNMAYDLKGTSEDLLWNAYDPDWIYDQYFATLKQLIDSELFNGLAHPDTIKMFNHYPSYDCSNKWEEIADALLKASMYTENNVGAHYRYNHDDIGLSNQVFAIFEKKGVVLYPATDSHSPETVGIFLNELSKR